MRSASHAASNTGNCLSIRAGSKKNSTSKSQSDDYDLWLASFSTPSVTLVILARLAAQPDAYPISRQTQPAPTIALANFESRRVAIGQHTVDITTPGECRAGDSGLRQPGGMLTKDRKFYGFINCCFPSLSINFKEVFAPLARI
jgi:hypothetical protein